MNSLNMYSFAGCRQLKQALPATLNFSVIVFFDLACSKDLLCDGRIFPILMSCLVLYYIFSFSAASNALRELSTTTSILVNPSNMPHEATESVQRNSNSPGPSYFRRWRLRFIPLLVSPHLHGLHERGVYSHSHCVNVV